MTKKESHAVFVYDVVVQFHTNMTILSLSLVSLACSYKSHSAFSIPAHVHLRDLTLTHVNVEENARGKEKRKEMCMFSCA